MPMGSISPDLHALNCKNCSQMVNWILVELEIENKIVFCVGVTNTGGPPLVRFLLLRISNYIVRFSKT